VKETPATESITNEVTTITPAPHTIGDSAKGKKAERCLTLSDNGKKVTSKPPKAPSSKMALTVDSKMSQKKGEAATSLASVIRIALMLFFPLVLIIP
jgi:hypothetical protein